MLWGWKTHAVCQMVVQGPSTIYLEKEMVVQKKESLI